MKKKLIGLLLVGVMTLASLTGCSTAVTAESLIDDAFKDLEYAEYDMSMSVQMAMTQSGMSMDMGIEADLTVEATEKTAHIKGMMEATVFGMTVEQEMENYQVIDGDTMTTYTYDFDYEQWSYAETEVDKDNDNLLPAIESDMFKNLEMEETKGGYEVTGVLANTDEFFGLQDETVNALAEGLSEVDILVTFTFNEDKEVESLEIKFDVDEDETYEIEDMGEVSMSEFSLSMEFKSFKGDEIEVPDEVIDEAVEEGDYAWDDDYDTEEEEDTEGTGEITTSIDVENIVFSIDGHEFTLGAFTYEELKNATGFVMDDSDYIEGEEYLVEADDYKLMGLSDEHFCYASVYFTNDTDEALDIMECKITGIYFDQQYEMKYNDTHHDFTICGLKACDSKEDVKAVIGAPYSTSEYDGYSSWCYYLSEGFDAYLYLYFDGELGLTGFDIKVY